MNYEQLAARMSSNVEFRRFEERVGTLRALALTQRRALNDVMDEKAFEQRGGFLARTSASFDTLIIGGGLHAAVYACNAAVLPVVAERSRLGGVFAISSKPAFRLNSRNRPDDGTRLPGGDGSLNYIPGGDLQVADLSTDEYPTQDNFALAIKANLIEQAIPLPATRVRKVTLQNNGLQVVVASNGLLRYLFPSQIIVATGIGDSTKLQPARISSKVLTFERWLGSLNERSFPWKDVKRLAVIGANDSGKVVIEHALGQGPSIVGSTNLDFVRHIDWYGQSSYYQEEFEDCERSRYVGIGRYMPRVRDINHFVRVFPIGVRATGISTTQQGPRIRYLLGDNCRTSAPYDLVVVCTGFKSSIDDLFKPLIPRYTSLTEPVFVEGELVARKYTGLSAYKVGPAADIPVDPFENLGGVPENTAAAFRYVEKTAKFARSMN